MLVPKLAAVATVEEVNNTVAPSFKCGSNFCKVKKYPFTLVLNCESKSSSVTSSIVENTAIPAFKNKTSILLPLSAMAFSNCAIPFKLEVSETTVFKLTLLILSDAF